jgi:drug/metabolite transporter (DMT)-like permease
VLTVVAVEGELTISTTGILFALGAALCFTAYLLSGDRLVTRTDPVVKALWVSAGAGVALAARAVLSGDALPPGERALELGAYGLANAAAFGCMFAALGRIGATRTAVVLNFEVVASVALAALLLSERLGPLQAVGAAAVVTGAVLAALVEGGDLVEEEAAPP